MNKLTSVFLPKPLLGRIKASASFFLATLLLSLSFSALAELEELEDKKLEEQTGKEGITIDLSYKLTIGEIAHQFSDQDPHAENRTKSLTEPPPRIEYVQGKN